MKFLKYPGSAWTPLDSPDPLSFYLSLIFRRGMCGGSGNETILVPLRKAIQKRKEAVNEAPVRQQPVGKVLEDTLGFGDFPQADESDGDEHLHCIWSSEQC